MNSVKIFLFPDVCPEEEACVRSCLVELQKSIPVQEIRVTESDRGFFKRNTIEGSSWIVSRDWKKALRFLSAFSAKSKILVSVLSTQSRKVSLWETWFHSLNPVLPPHIKLLAHSPLSYRFLRELAGIPDLQLEQLPLPLPVSSTDKKGTTFVVGAYGAFVPNNNLHFLITVGHYLFKRDRTIQLKLLGSGFLAEHLDRLARELGVSGQVQIVSTADFSNPDPCDVALYFPQRNDHFGSLLVAASAGAVPICGNITGIEDYVKDSVNGFIFQQEETRSIAESILTLKNHPMLCDEMRTRFRQDMMANFSAAQVSDRYLNVLKGNIYQTQNYIRHAI